MLRDYSDIYEPIFRYLFFVRKALPVLQLKFEEYIHLWQIDVIPQTIEAGFFFIKKL